MAPFMIAVIVDGLLILAWQQRVLCRMFEAAAGRGRWFHRRSTRLSTAATAFGEYLWATQWHVLGFECHGHCREACPSGCLFNVLSF